MLPLKKSKAVFSTLLFFAVFVRLSVQQAAATSSSEAASPTDIGTTTCYDYTGNAFPNNTICGGSNACCQEKAFCTTNRLCASTGNPDVLVRAPCAVYPWVRCANICLYSGSDGFLPRVNLCKDGSYCCDNDPACCQEGRGVVLDGSGDVAFTESGLSSTSTSSPTSASSTSGAITSSSGRSSAASTSGLAVQATNSSRPVSSGLSTGAKAGIAVGVIIGFLIFAAVGLLLLRNHQRITKLQSTLKKGQLENESIQMMDRPPYVDEPGTLGRRGIQELFVPPSEMPAGGKSPDLKYGVKKAR